MKTSIYADNCSQLSEKFMKELQVSGLPANNLAVNNSLPSSASESSNSESSNSYPELPPEFFYLQNNEGETQLHISIILEKVQLSAYLISIAPSTLDLDIVNDDWYTALHCAVLTGQPDIVRSLVLAGANTEIRTRQGETAFHLAVRKGDMECVMALVQPLSLKEKDELLKSNIPPPQLPVCLDTRNYTGDCPIHVAAKQNNVQMVYYLLLAGVDVNSQEGLGGRTPLHLAMEYNSEDVVHYLAQVPTTLCATTYGGDAAYQFALQYAPHYVHLLLSYGAVPVVRDLDDDSNDDSGSDGGYEATSCMELMESCSDVPDTAPFVSV